MTVRTRFAAAAAACLLLIGSGGCGSSRGPDSEIRFFSESAVLLDLPFEKQSTPNLCGLAAVEMLTRYFEKPLNDVQRTTLTAEASTKQGISGAMLKKTLEEAGYWVAVFPGTLEDETSGLFRHLDKRRPPIVMLESGKPGVRHYCLVTGYDPERRMIALMDPGRGLVAARLEAFLSSWAKANHFVLLAIPNDSIDP